jgi:acetamidase/formamidase
MSRAFQVGLLLLVMTQAVWTRQPRSHDLTLTPDRVHSDEAYALCSPAADLRVTQAVDQTKGVHAMLAKSTFR